MAGQQIDIVANLLMKVDGAEAGINKLKSSLSKLKMPEGLENSFKKSFANLDTLFARYKSQVEKGFDTKADVNAFSKTSKALDAELTRISKHFTELTGKEINFKVKSDDIVRTEKELEKLFNIKNQLSKESLKFEVSGGKNGVKDIETLLQKLQSVAGKTKTGDYAANALNFLKTGDVQNAIAQLDKASVSFKRLKQEKQDAFKATGFDMGGAIAAIITTLSSAEGKFGDVNAKIAETKNNLANFQADQIQKAGDYVEDLANKFAKDETAIRQADGAMQDFARSSQSMSQQLGDLQQSTQYFFSLRNMINLFKRGIDEAIQSVKELDAAMTETAVVTDYKVSDMWNMLPQYTQLANQLGATTQGAYETMTLYFQQGLDQQQAFELGAETMKMARIAGLDYAETTDMMTAALRGFNMELNETSAKRINDVYSELAAITASDTEELGTAMQRTASIAHSAGSSFEGTTAFLAQAIETTREPAENIGTAMKTIIARFQEMKKNPLEISEVDGEEVDYNKIDAALKTIGVDLKDANGQFRDFDKVMLDISAKWDTLSQSQQRYIATTAAGSRQQSRFIAMVSNYDRTMQLMEAANDSAGASEEQFGKTMDSLESKLNKLHNAWQQFTMGIANNGMIKLAVDGITKLLGGVNSLIDGLSLGSGTIKSFLSLFTAFTGLKASGKILNSLIGGLGGLVDPTSTFSAGFGRGFLGNRAAGNAQLASQINQPIVAELRALRQEQGQQIKQNQQNRNGAYDSYNQFKAANQQIRQLTGKNGYKVTQLKDILGSLDKGDQNKLMRHMSGTMASTRNSLMDYYRKQNPLAAQGIKQQFGYLNNQRKIGELSWKEYYDTISDPELLKRGLDTSTEAGKAAERMLTGMTAKVNQKVDSAVRSQALSNLSTNEEYNSSDRVNQQKIYQQEVNKLKADAKYMAETRTGVLEEMLPEIKNSKWAQRVDSLGKVSAGITSAGMGIQSFGNLLISSANPALQAFGSTLVSIGGVVSSLGMGLGGLASSFSAVAGSDFMSNIASKVGVGAGALTAGLGVAAAAIAGIAIAIKKYNDNIKKAAEEVTSNYKEQNEKHQSNISNLESYRADFARLSAGVDANGMNINLDTADYERYLEITRALADINPDIVDSYNAQGNAIISNKNALEDTLALEKERQAETFNTYTSDDSTNTLLKARNLSRAYKEIKTGIGGEYTSSQSIQGYEFAPQADMREQAKKIGQTLSKGVKEGWISEDALSDFDIKIDDLAKGTDSAVSAFEQNYDKAKARISSKMDSAGDELKDSTKESMLNAFSGYNEAADKLDELITPLYEQTLAKVGKEISIPAEFKSFLNQGIKDIVSDANITDIDGEVSKLTSSFSALGKEGSEYSKILADVEEAQDNYAASLDANAYDEFVHGTNGAVERIQALKDELLKGVDTSQGYGKAISEFLENEITKIEDFTKAGEANLQQALNTMTSEIEAAEGTLENFNKIVEGSTYGKAASNMSQIFETATADEHVLGQGDQAFWAGAEALVGRGNLLEGGGTNRDKALKQMKEVQEMLKGGQEGWDNFKIKWFDSADAKLFDDIKGLKLDDSGWISEIDESINPQVYDQIADALNMSKESLVAMLNLGRQFGEVDFTNVSDVRKALATSENTIKNSENGKVFVRKESLESEMTSAGIDLNKQQEIEQDLQKNYNTELIKSADEISKTNNQFAEMGITSMESLVKTFDDTGQFTKDEIQAYAEKFAEINGEGFNQSQFDEYWQNNQEDSQFGGIPTSLDSIQSILSSIENILASQRLSEGYLDNATADDSRKWLFGGDGEDTNAQKFWKGHGSGENGEIKTSEFENTKKELTDFISTSDEYIKKLNEAESAAKERGDYDEAKEIENERKDYEYMKERAQTYLDEGTEAYNNQIQSKLDAIQKDKEVIDTGLNDIFGQITPEQINTDAAQSTLSQLYDAAINNAPIALTDNLKTQMEDLGIDIQKAIDAGLVVDKNGVLTAAEETGKETAEAGVEGNASGQQGVDTKPAKAAGEKKGKETGEAGVEGNASGQSSVPHQAAPGMPSNVPANAAPTSTTTEVKVESEVDENGLEKAKTLITEVQTLAGQGATFAITTTGTGTLQTAATSAKTLTKNIGDKTVAVNAKVKGTDKVNELKKAIQDLSGKKVTVNVNHKGLTYSNIVSIDTAINNLNDKTITVTVKRKGSKVEDEPPHTGGFITNAGVLYRAKGGSVFYPKKGTDRIPAYLTPGEYVQNRKAVQYFGIDFMRQINHQNLLGALQSFGSAAKGRYGRLGPSGKGGLTLTGEKGFEVAWIPSENRSMILGTEGPQMADLPPDTIIWDHKQSKKIISQNAIPAGSHYVRGKKATDPRKINTNTNKGGGGGGKEKEKKKGSSSKKTSQAATAVIKITQKAGKVLVWWENAGHRMEKAQRDAEGIQRKLENLLKTFGTTAEEYKKAGEDYRKYLEQQKDIAAEREKRATDEFRMTDEGRSAVDETKVNKAREKMNAAKEKYQKNRTKANKEAWEKAQKSYRKAANSELAARGARREISYEYTKTTTKKGSKKKTQKVTKKTSVNLANYITTDPITGAYVIDQDKIDKIANGYKNSKGKWVKGNKSKAEAIAKAAEDQLNDLESKLKSAEDDRIKAEEELAEFYNTVYETFYAWEKTITDAYVLGQQIEKLGNLRTIFDAVEDLEFAKIEAGFGSVVDSLPKVTDALKQNQELMLEQVQANRQLIDATFKEYQSALSVEDTAAAAANSEQSEKAKKDAEARAKALEFLENIGQIEDFNYSEATNALNAPEWTQEDYDKIKDGLDQIAEKQTAYYDAISKTYESMTEVYQTIEEYQSYMSDFENDLISGMEEQANKEIDKLNKINSSIDTATKDLIDEVKRKLDERRKQEDNAKTERDIAQKQQRLAALRADTSGGHQVEIAQLEKEIAEAQQGYQRTLEDQLLDRLSNQADEASKQRERQIQLLEAQRDFAAATGLNVEQINTWLKDPKNNKEQIRAAWLANNGYEDAGALERTQLEEQFESAWLRFLAYREALPELIEKTETDLDANGEPKQILTPVENIQKSTEDILKNLQKGLIIRELTIADAKTDNYGNQRSVSQIKAMMGTNGQSVKAQNFLDEGFNLSQVAEGFSKEELASEGITAQTFADKSVDYGTARTIYSAEELSEIDAYKDEANKERYSDFLYQRGNKTKTSSEYWGKIGKQGLEKLMQLGEALGKTKAEILWDLVDTDALTWQEVITAAKKAGYSAKTLKSIRDSSNWSKGAKNNFGKAVNKVYGLKGKKAFKTTFATGGIANFTGPAWLDGTPSKPELVLNATDTKNFLALRDVLDRAMASTGSVTNSYGGNATYEININVDKIEKDYDVDRVAERVKKIIVKDSGYRNVTQVRNFR